VGIIVAYIDPSSASLYVTKHSWKKWDIFEAAFDLSSFDNDDMKLYNAFEDLWFNNDDTFQWWNCYGMALSAAMQYKYGGTKDKDFLKTHYEIFSKQIWTWTIWENIKNPRSYFSSKWDKYDNETDILKTILALQKSQHSYNNILAEKNSEKDPLKILKKLRDYPNETYMLSFFWKKNVTQSWSLIHKNVGHAVIPYKVEWNKIFIWDNNEPFNENNSANNQYIIIKDNWDFEIPKYSHWDSINEINIKNIEKLYNNNKKSTPLWYNNTDTLYTLVGESNMYVEDNNGNKSWFIDWKIIEEISWVIVIDNYIGENYNNTKKQIYLPKKQDLTVKVKGKKNEKYELRIAWWDYHTKIENIDITNWELDSFKLKRKNIEINFDKKKKWSYNLRTSNFQDNLKWTVYVKNIKSNNKKHRYIIDWDWLKKKKEKSILLEIDEKENWKYNIKEILVPTSKNSAHYKIWKEIPWFTNKENKKTK